MEDCGCMCMVDCCFCHFCTFSDAMAMGGIDPLDFGGFNRWGWCLALSCPIVPCQVQAATVILRQGIARKYGIVSEGIVCQLLKVWCCGGCIIFQMQSEVMKREGLRFTCAGVQRAAPMAEAMER